jgi:uncharacterized protein YegP (UPF0339 family)
VRLVIQRSGDQYYFEIQSAGNYETLATSERYRSKADCQRGVELIRTQAAAAEVVDRTQG